jgi:tripartite-type tricarboxylate transporter receptor subunit TctC
MNNQLMKKILFTCLLSVTPFAFADDNWPNKTITMIVPFPPGGVADTVARPVAEAISKQLKQPVIIENRAGAGGGVGMAAAARAKPDGYTILMALSSISIIPEADKILGKEVSYQLNQFRPIARFTADPTVLVVRADSPWKTYQEFIADMRKHTGLRQCTRKLVFSQNRSRRSYYYDVYAYCNDYYQSIIIIISTLININNNINNNNNNNININNNYQY